MLSPLSGSLTFEALLVILVLLRDWPRLLCAVAMAGCALPFYISPSAPLWRSVAMAVTCFLLVKALQFAAGHVRPRGWIDFGLFIFTFASVRWETPRRPDPRRAARRLLTGLGLLGLAWLVRDLVLRLDVRNPVQLFTTQLGVYLVVAGYCNLAVVKLSLRGLDHDDVFHNPFGSLNPAEFWGRRWNSYVGHLLHRYVFLPAGGRRRPVRGLLAAFGASAVLHEVIFDIGTQKFNGGMLVFFMLQGGLVAVTSRSRFYRRLARKLPVLAWLLTTVLMLGTGILFVYGMDGVDPSNAWRRVFSPT